MLGRRILTAAIALPLTILAILFLSPQWLAALVAVLMLLGAWEWGALAQLAGTPRVAFVVLAAVVMGGALVLHQFAGMQPADFLLLELAALFWLLVIGLVLSFPKGWQRTLGRTPLAVVVGVVVLVAPVVATLWLDEIDQGAGLILVLCLMVWGADTGAYAAGRTLGVRKLVPRVSPGKTLAGALGGIVTAMLIGLLSSLALGYGGSRILALVLLGAWIAVISIIGDLTLSMFKRSAGVKDSGRLFPGHGGVLDRLDSMLAAAPWFVLGMHALFSAT